LKEDLLATQTKVDLLTTQNKLVETQVAQQAAQFVRQPSILPPRPDLNLKDVKLIGYMLHSGTQYEDLPMPKEDFV
jgi:hypothetical protein